MSLEELHSEDEQPMSSEEPADSVMRRLGGSASAAAVKHGPHLTRGAEFFCGCGACASCLLGLATAAAGIVMEPAKRAGRYVLDLFEHQENEDLENL